MGEQFERKIGLDWTEKGPAPSGFLREKDATAILEAILTDARRGALEQTRTGLTTQTLAEDWIAYGIHERDWKPSTLSDNRSVVHAHIKPTFGSRRPEKITAEQIADWRDELVEERGVSRRTANKALVVLGAILERGRKHGLVANVAREVPKLRDRYDPNDYDFFSLSRAEADGDGFCRFPIFVGWVWLAGFSERRVPRVLVVAGHRVLRVGARC